jgi:LmbE family N-acetylglucosaminyl deacetylase
MHSDTVVVSPHLDDAVFSCWSVVARAAEVTVVTVFTGGPDDDRITRWDANTGVTSRERMRQRVAENNAALSLASARAANLGLLEAQYEGGPVRPDDLRETVAAAARVYVPAGVGVICRNPEHALVRDACLKLRPDAILYADNPYSDFRSDAGLPPEFRDRYQRRVIELDSEQRSVKSAAIRCYAGELAKLEGTFGTITDPDRLVYEVLWEPLSNLRADACAHELCVRSMDAEQPSH